MRVFGGVNAVAMDALGEYDVAASDDNSEGMPIPNEQRCHSPLRIDVAVEIVTFQSNFRITFALGIRSRCVKQWVQK